jgi:hypothetical protein
MHWLRSSAVVRSSGPAFLQGATRHTSALTGQTSSDIGGRRTEETFNQICQRPDFAIGQFSSPAGNRKAGGEGADKHGPVADRRTDVFAEGDEFFDQLLTFKRSPIHPVQDQHQARNAVRMDPNRVDDLKRAYGRLEVRAAQRPESECLKMARYDGYCSASESRRSAQ